MLGPGVPRIGALLEGEPLQKPVHVPAFYAQQPWGDAAHFRRHVFPKRQQLLQRGVLRWGSVEWADPWDTRMGLI